MQSWTSPGGNTPQSHLPPITKTIQVRRTRHAGHCWRSRDELIRDVLLWTPTHGRAKAGRPARTYIQQLCEDTGCCPEDPPRATNDREEWRERVRDIRATSATWWWWFGLWQWLIGWCLIRIGDLKYITDSYNVLDTPCVNGYFAFSLANILLLTSLFYYHLSRSMWLLPVKKKSTSSFLIPTWE